MQTILKVVHDNRGQASMVDDYLAQFCARSANEALPIESSSFDDDNIAFMRDDVYEFQDNREERQRAIGQFRTFAKPGE